MTTRTRIATLLRDRNPGTSLSDCSRCILTDLSVVRLPSGGRWLGRCERCGRPAFVNADGDPVREMDGVSADLMGARVALAS